MFLFFKQNTADGMRISDWSSDVCASDLMAASSPRNGCARVGLAQAHGADGIQRGGDRARMPVRADQQASDPERLDREPERRAGRIAAIIDVPIRKSYVAGITV